MEGETNNFKPVVIDGEKIFAICPVCKKEELILVGEQYKGRCVTCQFKKIEGI
jgi:hypothetical protein